MTALTLLPACTLSVAQTSQAGPDQGAAREVREDDSLGQMTIVASATSLDTDDRVETAVTDERPEVNQGDLPLAYASALSPTPHPDEHPPLRTAPSSRLAQFSDANPSSTPTTAPTPAAAAAEKPRGVFTYTIAAGDTLVALANKFGVTIRTIVRANDLAEEEILTLGRNLVILPKSGTLHSVVAGENVITLAERYFVIPEEIAAANGLVEPYSIYAGEKLLIPEPPDAGAVEMNTKGETPSIVGRAAQSYQVVGGDTLSRIAARFGASIDELLAANGLSLTKPLLVGQVLTIPPTAKVEYTVKKGDTVSAIAALHSASAIEIIKANGLVDPYVVSPGQTLIVPGGLAQAALAPPPTPTSPAPVATPTPTPNPTQTAILPAQARASAPSPTLQATPPTTSGNYQVVAGDTLSAISRRFGVTVGALGAANRLDPTKPLAVGQRLQIPEPAGTARVGTVGVPTAPPTQASTREASPTPSQTPSPTPVPVRATPSPAIPPPATEAATTDRAALVAKIIDIAKKQMGARYTWGGASPQTGFDCSGFVMYAYRQAGLLLPRDIWGQLNSGAKVDKAGLQAGDIVFFQNTYTPGLSHSGIALGDGSFIHAAGEQSGVIISRLDNQYWTSHYLTATRPK